MTLPEIAMWCLDVAGCVAQAEEEHMTDQEKTENNQLESSSTRDATVCPLVVAVRAWFDGYVRGEERRFPWIPMELLTALVEDYDRRIPQPVSQ